MTLLLGALTLGFIYALVALGVYISSRILLFRDLTVDGAFTFGACATTMLLLKGWNPALATLGGFLAGFVAGIVTGLINTWFQINGLIAGILVMTGLFSVNLRIMGKSNQAHFQAPATMMTWAEDVGARIFGNVREVSVLGWPVSPRDLAFFGFTAIIACAVGWLLYSFFRSDYGTAMRATGDNAQMVIAQGVNVGRMMTLGLALSNGLVGLGGALFAQYQGFADVGMGVGMLVWGLAAIVIGEVIVGSARFGLMITAAIMGSILARLLLAIALRLGLRTDDFQLVTALFLFLALILPAQMTKLKKLVGKK